MLRPKPLVISTSSSASSFSSEKKSKPEDKSENKRSENDKKKTNPFSQINLGVDKRTLFSKKKVQSFAINTVSAENCILDISPARVSNKVKSQKG